MIQYGARDLGALWLRATTGIAMLLIGWRQASREVLLDDQAPWLALAIAGTLVMAAAAAMWLLVLRRSVALRIARILTDTTPLAGAAPAPPSPARGARGVKRVAVADAGARLFHRPSCDLVAGRPVTVGTEGQHRRSGRHECGMCAVPRAHVERLHEDGAVDV